MSRLTLDLMDLADVGGQPRKLANEIQRQIRLQAGDLTLPMPLHEIATALGIEDVQERPTTTFEGMLVATADKSRGSIVLRAGMPTGRRNFTLGHEIGHFVNPYHKPPDDGFRCEATGLRQRRADGKAWDQRSPYERMEIEANEFSIALLVPAPEYRQRREQLSGCDLLHIDGLAKSFGISKEAMARIYVDTAPEKIGVLTSRNGLLQSFILPRSFPYLGLARGHPLPARSFSASYLKNAAPGQASELQQVGPDAWIDGQSRSIEVFEQAFAQANGWAMTMLLIEAPDEEEQEDEGEMEKRWSQPRFAYGR